MPYGMYLSAEGAMAQATRMEVIANNLANVDTPGFKQDVPTFQARFAEAIQQGQAQAGDDCRHLDRGHHDHRQADDYDGHVCGLGEGIPGRPDLERGGFASIGKVLSNDELREIRGPVDHHEVAPLVDEPGVGSREGQNTSLVVRSTTSGACSRSLADRGWVAVGFVGRPHGLRGDFVVERDSSGSVRAFDLSVSLTSSSSVYPEIGNPTTPADAPGTGVVMTISPDSRALFIAGNQHVLIMPAP